MEAATLKSKKQINKGKLKKTFKNVICRPDAIFWPQTSIQEGKLLEDALNKYKVEIPEFIKPSWKELSQIPKNLRPKPPPIPKVEGLIFGIGECQQAVETNKCVSVFLEAAVNPRTIVQSLIESCLEKSVPVLCLNELKRITKNNFGIPTSALGVTHNCLKILQQTFLEISKCHSPKQERKVDTTENDLYTCENTCEKKQIIVVNEKSACPYLYRTDKKTRVFSPTTGDVPILSNKFIGQDFIELSNSIPKDRMDRKQYMKMIVKRISSNPKRQKVSKPNATDK